MNTTTHGSGACVRAFATICALVLSSALTACDPGNLLGSGGDSGTATFTPNYSEAPPAHAANLPCGDSDPTHLCIALKYVSYSDPTSGQPIVDQSQAAANVQGINSVWTQCQVQFTLETYQAVNPATLGLPFAPATQDDLGSARQALQGSTTLLVTTSGQWTGDLGAATANAWSVLPPEGPFGSVLEASVATIPNLIAHELGHQLNLVHVADQYDVMNPIIYSNSLNMTDDQCSMARATAISFWGPALR